MKSAAESPKTVWARGTRSPPSHPPKACSSRAIAASSPRTVSWHSILSCAPSDPTWSCCGASETCPSPCQMVVAPLLIESREWYAALGSSRYLCQNIEFERYFRKRPYQRYLQTFHGYPFKSMGASLWRAQGRPESVITNECARRSDAWDAIVVPESLCVDLYRREYRFSGETLVTGYPRNDALLREDVAAARARVLEQLGIGTDRIIVLYAPTWRDTVATSPWTATLFDGLDLEALAEQLGDGYAVLLRGHNYNLREGLAPIKGTYGTFLPIRRSTTCCLPPTWQSLTIPPFGSTGSSRASQYCFSCQISWTI